MSVTAGGPGVPEGTCSQVRSTSVDRLLQTHSKFSVHKKFSKFLKSGSLGIISHPSCHVFRYIFGHNFFRFLGHLSLFRFSITDEGLVPETCMPGLQMMLCIWSRLTFLPLGECHYWWTRCPRGLM